MYTHNQSMVVVDFLSDWESRKNDRNVILFYLDGSMMRQ